LEDQTFKQSVKSPKLVKYSRIWTLSRRQALASFSSLQFDLRRISLLCSYSGTYTFITKPIHSTLSALTVLTCVFVDEEGSTSVVNGGRPTLC